MHVDADAAGLADTKGPLHKHWVCVRQRGGLQVRRRERTTCAVSGSILGDLPRVKFCAPSATLGRCIIARQSESRQLIEPAPGLAPIAGACCLCQLWQRLQLIHSY